MIIIAAPIALLLVTLFIVEFNKVSNLYVESFGFERSSIRSVAGRYSMDIYSKKGCRFSFSFLRCNNNNTGDNRDDYCRVWEASENDNWIIDSKKVIYTKKEFKAFIEKIESK